jgi:hypothetical protein
MNKIFMGILRLGRSNPMVLEIFATKKEIFLIISFDHWKNSCQTNK